MKLLNLVPVIGDAWTDEMGQYVFKYLRPDTKVETWNLKHGGTSSIEGEYDEMLAAPETVVLCQKAEKEGFDGVFINCFGDPGVRAAREVVDIPVFGGFEPVMQMALGTADRIGIVTVIPHPVSLIRSNIAKAGLNDRVVCVRNINVPVCDLQDHKKAVDGVVEHAIKAIEIDLAESIVMGCTGFVGVAEEVQKKLQEKGYNTIVLEAAQAAMMTLETYATMGLRHSRLTYLPPREKARKWWGE